MIIKLINDHRWWLWKIWHSHHLFTKNSSHLVGSWNPWSSPSASSHCWNGTSHTIGIYLEILGCWKKCNVRGTVMNCLHEHHEQSAWSCRKSVDDTHVGYLLDDDGWCKIGMWNSVRFDSMCLQQVRNGLVWSSWFRRWEVHTSAL